MKTTLKTIDQYIKSYPLPIQRILKKVRQAVRKAAPGATEGLSYGMPVYKLNGKYVVYFAAHTHHIGFYPTPSGTQAFKKELSKYKSGKGSAQFQYNEPIPYGLIAKIVRFRVKERS
ncbi:MAG: DUF1801 domain-containing protein [Patescibacteria group bacterium]|jgi:uncharacterized protein YdhG (YjbR/CyaY superfamily)